jgi:hypothetical protein
VIDRPRPVRVNSFSLARNAVRVESHSSRETTGWLLILRSLSGKPTPFLTAAKPG